MASMNQAVPSIDETSITTVLADDLHITGTITFKGSLMIKGSLDGEIVSEGLLIVGPTAKVKAKITTKNLVSHGEIQGDVTASEQVVLIEDRRPNGEHHHAGYYRGERLYLKRVDHDERNGECFQVRGTCGIAEALLRKTMRRSPK